MRKTLILCLFTLLLALWRTPIQARETLVQWSPQTHWQLATCMIAEADESKVDHVAVAYAAKNWLQIRQRRHPELRYTDILRRYCSVHKLSLARLSPRQRWIRQLAFPTKGEDGNPIFVKPADFPKRASWKRKERIWMETLQRAYDWHLGKHRDPCRGKAVHWGAPQDPNSRWYLPSDVPSDKLVRLHCNDSLENWYYRYKTKEEMAQDAQRQAGVRSAGVHGDV